jgi:hypothetical protein
MCGIANVMIKFNPMVSAMPDRHGIDPGRALAR